MHAVKQVNTRTVIPFYPSFFDTSDMVYIERGRVVSERGIKLVYKAIEPRTGFRFIFVSITPRHVLERYGESFVGIPSRDELVNLGAYIKDVGSRSERLVVVAVRNVVFKNVEEPRYVRLLGLTSDELVVLDADDVPFVRRVNGQLVVLGVKKGGWLRVRR